MSGGLVKGWYAPPPRGNICSNWENSPAPSHHEAHWFSIYSCLGCWNSAAQQLQRRSSSQNALAPLGAALFWGSDALDVNTRLCVSSCLYIHVYSLHLSCSSCKEQWLMLQQRPKDKDSTSWRPPAGLESRESGSLWHPSELWFIIVFIWAKGCCLWILWKCRMIHLSAYYPLKAQQPFLPLLPTLSTVI